jgi:hypothetical protein
MATSSSTRPGPGASRIVAIGRHPKPSTFATDAFGARVTPGPKWSAGKATKPKRLPGRASRTAIISASVPYCFGETRVATLALLTFTALSG